MKKIDGPPPTNQHTALDPTWVDVQGATDLLGVKKQTLYAYVSRGWIRTISINGRKSVYNRDDIVVLKARSAARAGHAAVASAALRFGEPVLDTSISSITTEGPLYRGRNSIELARSNTRFEVVAHWLWSGAWIDAVRFVDEPMQFPFHKLCELVPRDASPLERILLGVGYAVASDRGSMLSLDDQCAIWCRRVAVFCSLSEGGAAQAIAAQCATSIAEAVAIALRIHPTKRKLAAINRALIVMADHELNPSTFVARITSGAGTELGPCVLAGLAALSGVDHGRAADRADSLLEAMECPENAMQVLREYQTRGHGVPGFNQPLYPGGDPRLPILLETAKDLAPDHIVLRKALALIDAMASVGGPAPAVDMGLVALARALGAEAGGAVALMAVGRTAGWLAHAREQQSDGYALRPRARYSENKNGKEQ